MELRGHTSPATLQSIAHEAVATAQRWLNANNVRVPTAEAKLARLLCGEGGAQFVTDFIDMVIRPGDVSVAGKNLDHISRKLPAHINWLEGVGTHFAGGFAPFLPGAIVPIVRENFLRSVGHLFLRGDTESVEKQLAHLKEPGGIRPTVAPQTAVASGRREKHRQVADIHELIRRPSVEAVSIQPSAFLGRPRLIDIDSEVKAALELLEPLYETADHPEHPTFIDLDVALLEELEISLRVFERMMALFPQLNMGITLPACLPEALPALARVTATAQRRRSAGGGVVTVRFTRGEQVAHERAHATKHGWHPAPFATREEVDAHYLRLLDYALNQERTDAVRIISATHNLLSVAFAWRLSRARGVEGRVEHEFMLGVMSEQMEAAKRDVDGIRLFTPVVPAERLSLVAPYLNRRITDLSREPGYLAALTLRDQKEGFARERVSFLAAVKQATAVPVSTYRTQSIVRTEAADFTVNATREWASAALERAHDSESGESLLARSMIGAPAEREQLITSTIARGIAWGERRGATRATVLDSVAEVFAEWRGLFVETAVSESAMTLSEADVDVTVAIELARRAAQSAREIDSIQGVKYQPPQLIVVVSSRATPLATLSDSVLHALAAGGSVIIKTAPETRRSAAVFVEALLAAGVPEGLVAILDDEEGHAQALISDPRVNHVIHTGSRHTAKKFHSWRAETRISSMTGGRNTVIVTPNAHLETAVADIVSSAFDHAGQSAVAVGTVILVGNAGESARFLGRLSDAIDSLPIAAPGTIGSGLSALARPATARQRAILEILDEGEAWRVQPTQVDMRGRLWTPGLRDNVAANSRFRKTENRAPVVGIVRAHTLDEAVDIQNSLRFGLSAGIHSLDQHEIDTWLHSVEAGLLSVNCSPSSAMRGRAPVQGWNRSAVGTVHMGGFDFALTLGEWHPVAMTPGTTVTLEGISEPVARVITAAQPGMDFTDFDWVRTGARSDEEAWHSAYATRELTNTGFERIEHTYHPTAVTVRLSEGAPMVHLVRVLAAAALTQSAVAISTATPLHDDLIALFQQSDSPVGVVEVLVESEVRWRTRVQAGEIATTRLRLIGGERTILAKVLHGQLGVAVYADPVTTSGRVELLPFLRGQTICTNVQPLA